MTFLTRTSLKNRLVVGLITAAVALFGLFSMSALKQELMPSMTAPMAFIMIDAQGLAPEEMSRTVTEPAEQSLMAVPGSIANGWDATSTRNTMAGRSGGWRTSRSVTRPIGSNATDRPCKGARRSGDLG